MNKNIFRLLLCITTLMSVSVSHTMDIGKLLDTEKEFDTSDMPEEFAIETIQQQDVLQISPSVDHPFIFDYPDSNEAFEAVLPQVQDAHQTPPSSLPRTNRRLYQCSICSKVLSSFYGLKIHEITHVKFYECDHPGCNKAFSTPGNLNQHKRIHAKERLYVCDYPGCNKAFLRLDHLKRHERYIHNN